ncbi:MAG TPA: hypothetical protein VKB86_10290 [Pyrinomonadaceae bacterium]|nr:hypothetical protein [Pyrinomonadaceae bacterium]
MAAKLSVIFYILLCLEVGIVLTVLPWYSPFGLGDWGSNYFLLYAAHKTGLQGLQHAVSSGWFRGAITGLGLLNLSVAVWEIAHFNRTVRALQGGNVTPTPAQKDGANSSAPDHLPDNERQDETGHQPGQ